MEKIDWNEYFYYDETSPSCLRWKVDVFGGKNLKVLRTKKGNVAGGLDGMGYYRVMLKGKTYKCHRVIFEIVHSVSLQQKENIDHIDGNGLNNKISNLRIVSQIQNTRNKSMQKDNTTGKTGVKELNSGNGYFYYAAQWQNINGKCHCKCFSIAKLGLLPAFAQAVAHRERMIAELNKQGAGYSDRHGT